MVVLRLGDGRTAIPTTTTAVTGFLDEYNSTGGLIQTIALPVGPAVYSVDDPTVLTSAGCVFNPSIHYSGLMSRSVNGMLLAIACAPQNVGATIAASSAKTILGVNWDGSMSTGLITSYLSSALASVNWATAAVGGAVTDDGTNFIIASASGPIGGFGGRAAVGYQSGSTTAVQNVLWQPPYVHSVRVSSFATLAASGTATSSVVGSFGNSWGATGITVTSTHGGAWFENDLTLYIADSNSSSAWPSARMISKYVRNATFPNSPWAMAPGYPIYNATVTLPSGTRTTVYGARGLTGDFAADGSVRLFVTTNIGLLRFDTSAPAESAWTLLAAPCGGANMRMAGVAIAPALPSSTASPTASVSPSSSQTATVSVSQSVGATPTNTQTAAETQTPSLTASGTASNTPSISMTRTGTPSPLCEPVTSPVRPFSAGSVVVLRLGDGRATLPSSAVGTPGYLDEFSPSGTLLQTIALPVGPLVVDANNASVLTSAGCVFNPSIHYSGLMSRSVNGQLLAIACVPQDVGVTIPASGAKTVLGVRPDGSWAATVITSYLSSTGVTTAWATAAVGGAVTDDGTNYIIASGGGPIGAFSNRVGLGYQSGATTSAQNVLWQPPYVHSVRVSSFATLAASGTATSSVVGSFGNSWSATGITVTSTNGGAWFENDLTLWLADSDSTSAGRMLAKYTRNATFPNSPWAIAPGYPINNATVTLPSGNRTTVAGARGLTGSIGADGSVKLYLTTNLGLLRFETSAPAESAWTLLAAPCGGANMRYAGVALAPALPSPTSSPTSSLTPSSSATATPTASLSFGATATTTATMTVSTSQSRTPSASLPPSSSSTPTRTPPSTGTPSITGSVQPSVTSTTSGSVTMTSSMSKSLSATMPASTSAAATRSPSRSLSATASVSVSSTPSPSTSLSGTGSGSVSATCTGSVSASHTLPPSLTASVTRSLSGTKTVAPTSTRTKSGTATRTKIKTKTKTKTKVRRPLLPH